MKQQVPLESIKRFFQEKVDSISRQSNLNPKAAIIEILLFFEKYEVHNLDFKSGDNDILLFQYGSYNFKKRKEFYLDITRQFKIDDGEDEFYQLSLTLFYDLQGFDQVKSYNSWSIAFPSVEDWSTSLTETEGYMKAIKSNLIRYEIELRTT